MTGFNFSQLNDQPANRQKRYQPIAEIAELPAGEDGIAFEDDEPHARAANPVASQPTIKNVAADNNFADDSTALPPLDEIESPTARLKNRRVANPPDAASGKTNHYKKSTYSASSATAANWEENDKSDFSTPAAVPTASESHLKKLRELDAAVLARSATAITAENENSTKENLPKKRGLLGRIRGWLSRRFNRKPIAKTAVLPLPGASTVETAVEPNLTPTLPVDATAAAPTPTRPLSKIVSLLDGLWKRAKKIFIKEKKDFGNFTELPTLKIDDTSFLTKAIEASSTMALPPPAADDTEWMISNEALAAAENDLLTSLNPDTASIRTYSALDEGRQTASYAKPSLRERFFSALQKTKNKITAAKNKIVNKTPSPAAPKLDDVTGVAADDAGFAAADQTENSCADSWPAVKKNKPITDDREWTTHKNNPLADTDDGWMTFEKGDAINRDDDEWKTQKTTEAGNSITDEWETYKVNPTAATDENWATVKKNNATVDNDDEWKTQKTAKAENSITDEWETYKVNPTAATDENWTTVKKNNATVDNYDEWKTYQNNPTGDDDAGWAMQPKKDFAATESFKTAADYLRAGTAAETDQSNETDENLPLVDFAAINDDPNLFDDFPSAEIPPDEPKENVATDDDFLSTVGKEWETPQNDPTDGGADWTTQPKNNFAATESFEPAADYPQTETAPETDQSNETDENLPLVDFAAMGDNPNLFDNFPSAEVSPDEPKKTAATSDDFLSAISKEESPPPVNGGASTGEFLGNKHGLPQPLADLINGIARQVKKSIASVSNWWQKIRDTIKARYDRLLKRRAELDEILRKGNDEAIIQPPAAASSREWETIEKAAAEPEDSGSDDQVAGAAVDDLPADNNSENHANDAGDAPAADLDSALSAADNNPAANGDELANVFGEAAEPPVDGDGSAALNRQAKIKKAARGFIDKIIATLNEKYAIKKNWWLIMDGISLLIIIASAATICAYFMYYR